MITRHPGILRPWKSYWDSVLVLSLWVLASLLALRYLKLFFVVVVWVKNVTGGRERDDESSLYISSKREMERWWEEVEMVIQILILKVWNACMWMETFGWSKRFGWVKKRASVVDAREGLSRLRFRIRMIDTDEDEWRSVRELNMMLMRIDWIEIWKECERTLPFCILIMWLYEFLIYFWCFKDSGIQEPHGMDFSKLARRKPVERVRAFDCGFLVFFWNDE